MSCEECDRERVCYVLGECFLTHPRVAKMPPFLKKQISNARSVKQALQIFKLEKHVQANPDHADINAYWD